MQVAVTASRTGPSPQQFATLQRTLSGLITVAADQEPPGEPLLLRHGDCIGGDAAAHEVADALNYGIIIHPAKVPPHLRAFKPARLTNNRPPIIVLEPEKPLVRNRIMVDLSERLVAMPDTTYEKFTGSGTWYTIHYARHTGEVDILIIWPDGSTKLIPGHDPRVWP